MAQYTSPFSLENEIFSKFAFYSSVVLVKTLLMSLNTARVRSNKSILMNEEDAKLTSKLKGREIKPILSDPDVDRIRRAHLNDLENILPFVLIGIFYVASGPSSFAATCHFATFTVFRICHTIAYLAALPAPSRSICFAVGMTVNMSMLLQVLRATW